MVFRLTFSVSPFLVSSKGQCVFFENGFLTKIYYKVVNVKVNNIQKLEFKTLILTLLFYSLRDFCEF